MSISKFLKSSYLLSLLEHPIPARGELKLTNKEIEDGLTDYEVLFLTIVGEARGQLVEGQVAVGNVIMNRAKLTKKSVKSICLAPKQFSCWNMDDPNRPLLESLVKQILKGGYNFEPYKQIQWVAGGILEKKLKDNTKGVLNYMTTSLFHSPARPSWAKIPKTEPLVIGSHIFFTA